MSATSDENQSSRPDNPADETVADLGVPPRNDVTVTEVNLPPVLPSATQGSADDGLDEDTSPHDIAATVVVGEESAPRDAAVDPTWVPACEGDPAQDATIATQMELDAEPPASTVYVSERSVIESTADAPSAEFGDPADFKLQSLLGRGGMGAVWQAYQASIDRSVALKMTLDPKGGDERVRRKFLEEAMVTGALEHPNIVPIYDLGRAPDGRLFYVMKQVQGTPWKDVLGEKTLKQNLGILLRACDAVAFANSRGVTHRDLKPENIMLGEFGEVLVMDWGLALVEGRHNEQNSSLGGTPGYMAPEMATGPIAAIGAHSDIYLLGAILFELVTGRKPHAGKDVMDCLLAAANNEIVKTDEDNELLDVARKAMSTKPANRHASVLELQQEIRDYSSHQESIALEETAAEVLEQAQRTGDYDQFAEARFGFQSAIELWEGNDDARAGLMRTLTAAARAALEKGDFELGLSVLRDDVPEHDALREELVSLQQERVARAHRLHAFRRMALGLAAGLVIVMLVSIVWIRAERDEARTQSLRAEKRFDLAQRAVDEMLTEVGDQELQDVPQMEPVRRKLLQKVLVFYSEFLKDQPNDPALRESLRAETARAYHRVGDIARMLGQHDEADVSYNKAIDLFEELRSDFPSNHEYSRLWADSHHWHGELLRIRGETEGAEHCLGMARDRLNELVSLSPETVAFKRDLARTQYNLGLLYRDTDRPKVAREAYDNAVEVLTGLMPDADISPDELDDNALRDRQELARAYLNRGILNRGTEMEDEARNDYDEAMRLLKALCKAAPERAEYRKELAIVLNNLGNLLVSKQDRRQETEEFYEEGLALTKMLVKDFPNTPEYRKLLAEAHNSLAALYYYGGDFPAAEQRWMEASDTIEELIKAQPDIPEYQSLLARTVGNLGTVNARQGEFDTAITFLKEAVTKQNAIVDSQPENPDFRAQLGTYLWTLTLSHLGRKDHVSAAETVARLAATLPDKPDYLYLAATLTARCIPLATDDDTVPSDDRQSLIRKYQEQSIASLNAAIDAGWGNRSQLDKDIEGSFGPIKNAPEFQAAAARVASAD